LVSIDDYKDNATRETHRDGGQRNANDDLVEFRQLSNLGPRKGLMNFEANLNIRFFKVNIKVLIELSKKFFESLFV